MSPRRTEAATVVRAAVYTRISKDGEGLRAGVERQEADCRALAERKGWTVAEVFTDNDLSAWSGKRRPDYERVLAAIRAREVDAVVVWHLDRLTRTPAELEEFFKVCDAANLTKMATVSGDIDLAERDGRLQARILGAVARKSSDDASARIRRAFDEKAAAGAWKRGGKRPYGYEWSVEAANLIPFEPEALLVREAAERIIAGESRRRIIVDWHARGILTSEGKPWSITRVAEVLRSPTVAAKRIHRGEVVGDGTWEPILSPEKQAEVVRKLRRVGNNARPGRQRHLLTGILACGVCGSSMSAKRRADRGTRTYTCLSDRADRCGKIRVNAEPVERIALDTAFEWYEPDPVATPSLDGTTSAIDDRLAELADVEADLATARREGLILGSVFLAELQAIADERRDLDRKRAADVPRAALTTAEFERLAGPPASMDGLPPEVVEFWRSVVHGVFARIAVLPVGKGHRFSHRRLVLEPREGYEGAWMPILGEIGSTRVGAYEAARS